MMTDRKRLAARWRQTVLSPKEGRASADHASHGLYLLAGYTYAHAIDTATSNLAGVPPDSNNYNEERGNGDFDIRHRFTLSMTYDLPSMKTRSQLLEGWQVTSIVNLQAGEPYTLGDFNDDISLT